MSEDADLRAFLVTEGVPFIRTDFSSDGWESVVKVATAASPEGFRADVTVISDPQYSGWSVDQVRPLVDASRHGLVVLVDDFALNNPGFPLLVASVEFDDDLRCEAASLARVENNLSLGNTDWVDYYRSTDADGVYRGSSRSNDDVARTTYRESYLGTRERLESLIRTIVDQRHWRFVERSDADLAFTDVWGHLLKLRFEPNDDGLFILYRVEPPLAKVSTALSIHPELVYATTDRGEPGSPPLMQSTPEFEKWRRLAERKYGRHCAGPAEW